MNNSGLAVSYWKNWLKIDNNDIMILVDDLHINIGDITKNITIVAIVVFLKYP